MRAFAAKVTFPKYGPETFRVLVCCSGSKADVERLLKVAGWEVKRVSDATQEDTEYLHMHDEGLRSIHKTIRRRQEEAAEQAARREVEARRKAQEHAAREAARRKQEEESHEIALTSAVGDLLSLDLEASLNGNTRLAAICAKAILFFDQASMNKKDLFTAISIDFADFQATEHGPKANKMLTALLADLNEYLGIEAHLATMQSQLHQERALAEGRINSIASRTHVFGGSGEWLLLSMLDADRAVKADEKQIRAIHEQQYHLQATGVPIKDRDIEPPGGLRQGEFN